MKTLSPYSIVKLSLTVLFVGCVVLGAATAVMLERERVRGVDSAVAVTTSVDPDSSRRFIADVEALSANTGATVVVDRTDFGVRTLYVAQGGHGARWLRDGYTSFTPSLTYVVRPLTDLPDGDIKQGYDMSGGEEVTRQFVDLAHRYGADTITFRTTELQILVATPFGVGLLEILFISLALLLYAVIVNGRRYAVLSLHGAGPWRMFLGDLRAGLVGWVPFALAAAVVGAVVLYLATSVDGLVLFGRHTLLYAVALMLVHLVVWWVACLCSSRVDLIRSLAGKVPALTVVSSGLGLRLVSVILLVVTTVSLWNHLPEFLRQEQMRADVQRIGGLYRVSVNAGPTGEDLTTLEGRLTQVVNRLKAEGKVLEFTRFETVDRRTVLMMNRSAAATFLSDSARRAVEDVPEGAAVFLHGAGPTAGDGSGDGSGSGDVTALVESASRGYYGGRDLCGERGCDVRVPDGPYSVLDPVLEPGMWKSDVVRHDPMVLVAPDDVVPADDSTVLSLMSTGNILFRDREAVNELADDDVVRRGIFLQRTVLDSWDESHNQFRMTVTADVVAAVVAVVAVLGLGLGFAYVCYLAWYQRFRVGFIFGLGVVRRFRAVLVMEAVTVMVALGLLGGIYAGYAGEEFSNPVMKQAILHVISPWAVVTVAGVVLGSSAVILSALGAASRRIQKSRAV